MPATPFKRRNHAKRKVSGKRLGRTDIKNLREAGQLSAKSRRNRTGKIVDGIAAEFRRQSKLTG